LITTVRLYYDFQTSRGVDAEKEVSCKIFEKAEKMVLIDQASLRRRGMGQVDMAYLDGEDIFHLIEVKGQRQQEKQEQAGQLKRLRRSAFFLTELLNFLS
jgi:hypothetical protein